MLIPIKIIKKNKEYKITNKLLFPNKNNKS